MDDQTILKHIQDLVDEEHQLMEQHTQGELASHEHKQTQALEVSLDQCWDLLRAHRHADLNPEDACSPGYFRATCTRTPSVLSQKAVR